MDPEIEGDPTPESILIRLVIGLVFGSGMTGLGLIFVWITLHEPNHSPDLWWGLLGGMAIAAYGGFILRSELHKAARDMTKL
jgi:hypothetical protein